MASILHLESSGFYASVDSIAILLTVPAVVFGGVFWTVLASSVYSLIDSSIILTSLVILNAPSFSLGSILSIKSHKGRCCDQYDCKGNEGFFHEDSPGIMGYNEQFIHIFQFRLNISS